MSANNVQFKGTTAEVAETKSSLSDWQLLTDERGFRRRICLMPNRANPGAAQKMCRTVTIVWCCAAGKKLCVCSPCCVHGDFLFERGNDYEEDTFYYPGKGQGDP